MGARPGLDDEEQVEILGLMEKGESVRAIARVMRRNKDTIAKFVRAHSPKVTIARARLRASADILAERVIKDASPAEAIRVLSDKTMGVLTGEPKEAGDGRPSVLICIGMGPDAPCMVAPTLVELQAAQEPRKLTP